MVSLSNIPPLLADQSFSYLSQSDVTVHSCIRLFTFQIPSFQFGNPQYIHCIIAYSTTWMDFDSEHQSFTDNRVAQSFSE